MYTRSIFDSSFSDSVSLSLVNGWIYQCSRMIGCIVSVLIPFKKLLLLFGLNLICAIFLTLLSQLRFFISSLHSHHIIIIIINTNLISSCATTTYITSTSTLVVCTLLLYRRVLIIQTTLLKLFIFSSMAYKFGLLLLLFLFTLF